MLRHAISLAALALAAPALLASCTHDPDPPRDDAAVTPIDAASSPDAFATVSTCTSGVRWTRGDQGSILMHPGVACTGCHASRPRTPHFSFGGTVYATAHEPDDCYGVDGLTGDEVHIVVTGADGQVHDVLATPSGNFYDETAVVLPLTAEIRYQGRTRAMTTPATNGDCNACHTEAGAAGAPGRIVLP